MLGNGRSNELDDAARDLFYRRQIDREDEKRITASIHELLSRLRSRKV